MSARYTSVPLHTGSMKSATGSSGVRGEGGGDVSASSFSSSSSFSFPSFPPSVVVVVPFATPSTLFPSPFASPFAFPFAPPAGNTDTASGPGRRTTPACTRRLYITPRVTLRIPSAPTSTSHTARVPSVKRSVSSPVVGSSLLCQRVGGVGEGIGRGEWARVDGDGFS